MKLEKVSGVSFVLCSSLVVFFVFVFFVRVRFVFVTRSLLIGKNRIFCVFARTTVAKAVLFVLSCFCFFSSRSLDPRESCWESRKLKE